MLSNKTDMFSNASGKNKKAATRAVAGKEVKDYSNDPFFVQKAEASKKVIEKYGLPKNFLPKAQ